jgi:hypothetical protein
VEFFKKLNVAIGGKMKSSLVCSSILSLAFFVSGCASIVGNPTQLMPIRSTPSDATILVTDEKGLDVFKGMTPTSVMLQKSDGSYWGKKSYIVRISKDGFESQSIQVTASANGWYIGGNIVFGGLIGWFIVDPWNGNMYNLSPEAINSTLLGKIAHNNTATDGSISIMLIQDVPAELRSKMQRIN